MDRIPGVEEMQGENFHQMNLPYQNLAHILLS